MSYTVASSSGGHKHLDEVPARCPFCHNVIVAIPLYGYRHRANNNFHVFFMCPDRSCNETSIGYYSYGNDQTVAKFNNRISIGNLEERSFNDTITEISPQFIVIFNQAFSAEQYDLLEICGVGYRKALEFLIKDYAVLNNSDKQEQIHKATLSNVIETYVTDGRIKSVAKRAVWLGNDETHYVRKWEGKDLNDLKKLIELTLHWIEMEALTKSFNSEMPG